MEVPPFDELTIGQKKPVGGQEKGKGEIGAREEIVDLGNRRCQIEEARSDQKVHVPVALS